MLSFGGTKNGAVAAEAVIVMNPDLTEAVPFQRKQLLQLGSKMRFLAAQFAGLLENETWLANATQANLMAQRLSAGLRDIPGVTQRYPSSPTPFSPRSTRASSSRCSTSGASTSGTSRTWSG